MNCWPRWSELKKKQSGLWKQRLLFCQSVKNTMVTRQYDKEVNSIFTLASVRKTWLIIDRVHPQQKNSSVRRIAKSAIAGLLLASVLLTTAMAACPALHEFFHRDADHADHQCAVTLFTHGQFMPADTAPVLAVFALLFLFGIPLLTSAEFSSVDLRLGFRRAPPHFFSLR
jgi:hypothetical protein